MEETILIDVSKKWIRSNERLEGEIFWALKKAPKRILLRFGWFTEGRGTTDNEVVGEEILEDPDKAGERAFSFPVPDGPYSFEGHLITLTWVVEVIVGKEDKVVRERIDLLAGDDLIRLRRIENEGPRKSFSVK